MKLVIILASLLTVALAQSWAQTWMNPLKSIFGERPRPCKSSGDCDAFQCCLHQPAAWHHYVFGYSGICQPSLKAGDYCSATKEDVAAFGTSAYSGRCPCSDGLDCTSSNTKLLKYNIKVHKCTVPEVEGSGEGE